MVQSPPCTAQRRLIPDDFFCESRMFLHLGAILYIQTVQLKYQFVIMQVTKVHSFSLKCTTKHRLATRLRQDSLRELTEDPEPLAGAWI